MSQEPSRAIKLFGTEAAEPPSRVLRAGALSAELDAGALRYVTFHGVEVLRAIAYLVRDENWGTYAPEISDLRIREDADGFRISYLASVAGGGFTFAAEIVGKADGSLRFEGKGQAHRDLVTNRTGFVILHPLRGVAGRPVKVEHVDGQLETAEFPAIINPLQPFYDIRSLSHEALPGVWATCRMEGDSWEMEDHRNWTDASFKTYVRPLARPWPYTIAAGSAFTQSVTLGFSGTPAGGVAGRSDSPRIALAAPTGARMPKIGLGVPAAEAAGALAAVGLLKAAAPQLLVCQLDLRRGHGAPEVDRCRALSAATGADIVLEIVIPGKDDPAAELGRAASAVAAAGLRPAAVAVSPAADLKAVLPGSKGPEVPPLAAIYRAARAAFPGVTLGGGMFSYFTELNRKRPPAELLDYVTHTTCPIVHAADDRSVMETLEALPYVIRSARGFIGDRAYRIGPSAIGARDNPYGATTAPNPDGRRICLTDNDPRQRGLFGAAWYLGYIAAFARGALDAVTVAAPTGPFGIIAGPGEGRAVHPAYHVVAGLAAGAGRPLVPVTSATPAAVDGVAWESERGAVLWLANLTATAQPVALDGLSGRLMLRLLDEDSFVAATSDPQAFAAGDRPLGDPRVTLGSYAVARIEAIE